MIGNNKLEVTQATMQIIVQEWLERTFVKCNSNVTQVFENKISGTFEIILKEKELDEMIK